MASHLYQDQIRPKMVKLALDPLPKKKKKAEPSAIDSKCRTTLDMAGLYPVAAYQMSRLLGAPPSITSWPHFSILPFLASSHYPKSISWHLFGDLDSTGGTKCALDCKLLSVVCRAFDGGGKNNQGITYRNRRWRTGRR